LIGQIEKELHLEMKDELDEEEERARRVSLEKQRKYERTRHLGVLERMQAYLLDEDDH